MIKPDISVITATLNQASTLKHCLDSVARQEGVTLEHIVIDGGSADGSVQLLKKSTNTNLVWISEPDHGIADAMNKGAALAEGRWLYFLHADDVLIGSTELKLALACEWHEDPDLIVAGIQYNGRNRYYCRPGRICQGWTAPMPFKLPYCHQGILTSSRAWRQIGLFDTEFRITMDFDWMLRAYWSRLRLIRTGIILAVFGAEGVSSSSTTDLYRARIQEENRARLKNAPNLAWNLAYRVFWLFYYPFRMSVLRSSVS